MDVTFPIQHLFPREGYLEACKGDKSLTPIYLIALKQPNSMVCKQYGKKNPSYAEPRFKLTALAVATMMGNHEVMKYLLGRGVDRAPADCGGLTPLHYACALGDVESMKLLGETRKVFEIFPGWEKVINPPIPSGAAVVTCRNDTPVTAQQFLDSTGARFYDGIVASPQQFVNLLAKRLGEKKPDPADPYFLELFKQFEAHPPKLRIKPQGNAGDGLFAGENIPAGRIFTVYGSDVDVLFGLPTKKNTDYVHGDLDGTKTRGHGVIANDSFPNASFWPVYLPDGRVYLTLISVVKIKKGSPVFVDYGSAHRIKVKDVHQELNAQEMEAYFGKNPLSELISSLKRAEANAEGVLTPSNLIRYQEVRFRLAYLLNTPSAVFSLFLKGILSKKDLAFLRDDKVFKLIRATGSLQLEKQCQMLYRQIEGLSKIFDEKSAESRALKTMLLGFLGQYPFQAIVNLCGSLTLSLPVELMPSWKDKFRVYPEIMREVAYFGSLLEPSSTQEVDQKVFIESSAKLSQAPRLKMYIALSLFQLDHLKGLEKLFFGASNS